MVQVIRVEPIGNGWSVHCEGSAEPVHYLSGGRAEATARTTAARLAATGMDVRVDVHDREQRPIGVHWFSGEN